MTTTLAHNGLPDGIGRFELLRVFEQVARPGFGSRLDRPSPSARTLGQGTAAARCRRLLACPDRNFN